MTPMDEKNKKNETYPKGMSTDLSPVLPLLSGIGVISRDFAPKRLLSKGWKIPMSGALGV